MVCQVLPVLQFEDNSACYTDIFCNAKVHFSDGSYFVDKNYFCLTEFSFVYKIEFGLRRKLFCRQILFLSDKTQFFIETPTTTQAMTV